MDRSAAAATRSTIRAQLSPHLKANPAHPRTEPCAANCIDDALTLLSCKFFEFDDQAEHFRCHGITGSFLLESPEAALRRAEGPGLTAKARIERLWMLLRSDSV
jgi:hypothetical protein